MDKTIKLSDHFSFSRLLRFVLPSIMMMIFTSVYVCVDGFFVSNFASKSSFAALNLIFPYIQIMAGPGFMLAAGGVALTAKSLGEKNKEKANNTFSLIIYTIFTVGVVISVIAIIFARTVALKFGATDDMLDDCVIYAAVCLAFNPLFMLQNAFQLFFNCAEKPKMGLAVTITAGLTNMVLDAVFIAIMKMGILGAALATGIGQSVGAIVPLIYFFRKNKTPLKLGKAKFDGKSIVKATTNGSSELMTQISTSIVSMLYNFQLMKIAGEDGVSAYGVLMYLGFIFVAIFIGFSMGVSPIVSYNFGAKNTEEMHNLFKKSLLFNLVGGLIMMIISVAFASPISKVFVGYDKALLEMTTHAFRLFAFQFIFSGINIFSSGFFTALSNGAVSAIISFSRTLLFQIVCVLVLPMILGINGIWLSTTVAEVFGCIVSISFLCVKRKKYKY